MKLFQYCNNNETAE